MHGENLHRKLRFECLVIIGYKRCPVYVCPIYDDTIYLIQGIMNDLGYKKFLYFSKRLQIQT
jgi:hypothetical protein